MKSRKFTDVRIGGYAHVYRRPGEDVKLDLNFFDGPPRTVEHAAILHHLLSMALVEAMEWTRESISPISKKT